MFNGKVLVVVDMQNDFISGALGSASALQTVIPVREKIAQAHKEGTPVFFTLDTHEDDYLKKLEGIKLPVPHCVYGTEGWQLHPVIHGVWNPAIDFQVCKTTFGSTDLPDEIVQQLDLPGHWDNEIAEIEVCGLCTDICVMANAVILRSAFPNTIIKVDSKACAGTSADAHNAALMTMKSLQIDVI